MLRLALSQMPHRIGRTVALLLALVIATGSFTALTGSVETSTLEVRGTVADNFRSTYDLLVRPPESFTPLETTQGLVRPNYQSGIFGGITRGQLGRIRGIRDVAVAAPVSNIGFVMLRTWVPVTVPYDAKGPDQQLFRVTPTWHEDSGTTTRVGTPQYVYVSRNRTAVVTPHLSAGNIDTSQPTYAELAPGGAPVPVCAHYGYDLEANPRAKEAVTAFGYRSLYLDGGGFTRITCYYTKTTPAPPAVDQPFVDGAGDPATLETRIQVSHPMLLAAIDPAAETQLSDLRGAVVSGRMLTAADRPVGDDESLDVPVLAASRSPVDTTVSARIDAVDLPAGGIRALLGKPLGGVAAVAARPGREVAQVPPQSTTAEYARVLQRGAMADTIWQVGPVTYDRRGPVLAARTQQVDESVFETPLVKQFGPEGSDDTSFRSVSARQQLNREQVVGITPVGSFDPDKVNRDAGLSGVTTNTYRALRLEGADQTSRDALGGASLGPSSNLGGYLAQPPMLLTTLDAAAPLLNGTAFSGGASAAPISVIRVRVSGDISSDAVSRERLNQVALAIKRETGLAVDIVAGASGVPQTIALPAGAHGRPELDLTENWAHKGVAYTVIDEVDRKSLLLFVLILAVCGLAVANATSAAVRDRRSELGVLSTLGWPTSRIFGVVLGEIAVIGLVAGVVGSGLALLLGCIADVAVSPSRALVAVPCAVALALLAGAVPAFRAARVQPVEALRPDVRASRSRRRVRSVGGLARAGLARTPSRTALAVIALTIAISGVAALLTLQRTFSGAVVGNLLGDAVALQVRAADVAAVAAVCALAGLAVADVIYLGVREQAGELAALRAMGWRDADVTRLLVGQGLRIGVLGAVSGAALGTLAVAGLGGGVTPAALQPLLLAVAIGLLLSVAAAIAPALLVRSWPIAPTLSSEES